MRIDKNRLLSFHHQFSCQNNKFVKGISNVARTTFSEFIAFFKIIFLFPYAIVNLNSKNVKKCPKNVPIIFVHGLLHNQSGWVPLIKKIRADEKMKHNPIYTLNLSSTLQSIKKSSMEVRKIIDQAKEESGSDKVIIVGHSMGGIVSADTAQNSDDVAGVILLSSPVDGTRTSPLIPFVKSVREMSYKSKFIKKLKKGIKTAPKAKYLFIGNYGDLIVVPNTSTVGNGKTNQDFFRVPRTGHLGVFFHKDVHKKAIERIKEISSGLRR